MTTKKGFPDDHHRTAELNMPLPGEYTIKPPSFDCTILRIVFVFLILMHTNGCQQGIASGGGTSTEVVGRISTAEGAITIGLPVLLYDYHDTLQWATGMQSVSTDQQGYFNFNNVGTGRYLLKATDDEGRSLMQELVIDNGTHQYNLGTLIIDSMGTLAGFLRGTTGTAIADRAKVCLYKGLIPVCNSWIRDDYSIDSLPPGDFRVLIRGEIERFDDAYHSRQSITLFDSSITIPTRVTTVIDTIDINEAALRTDDPAILAEIDMVKKFLIASGCNPTIPAAWIHPYTGHIRIVEARTVLGMTLDTAAHMLGAINGIEKIRLSGFRGTKIPEPFFSFSGLTELSLTDGNISEVPGWITALTQLRIIRLTNNALVQLPEVVLDRSIPSLLSADFTGNPLGRIEWDQQKVLNTLLYDGISIILSGMAFAIDERDYRALLSLFMQNGLDDRIVHRYITTGTESDEANRIITLTINDATISRLPEEIGDLTGLRSLYIGNNSIDTLPEALRSLVNLEHLHLANGTISVLPQQLGGCTNLRTIDFSNNRIHYIPKWFGTLSALEYADFSNNCIDTVTTGFPANCIIGHNHCNDAGPMADSLHLQDSIIAETIVTYGTAGGLAIPMQYVQWRNNRVVLLRLVIDNEIRMNALDTLCSMAAMLDSLQTLHLVMRNRAARIPDVSTVFPHLEEFIGTGGALKALSETFTTSFPALRRISLPGNRFKTVPPSLRSMPSLIAVDLYFNYLTDLPIEDSLWLDGVSAADRRVLWDSGFSFTYALEQTWYASQFQEDSSGGDVR